MWKKIPNFNNYEIDEDGNIKSLYHNIILKQFDNGKGYKSVCLYKNGETHRLYVHQLVGLTFLNKPNGKYEINHIDGNKNNNNVKNLEWVTKSYNHLHRVYELKNHKNHQPKPVKCIETGKIYPSITIASKCNNLKNPVSIYDVIIGRRKTANGYHWCYVNKSDIEYIRKEK